MKQDEELALDGAQQMPEVKPKKKKKGVGFKVGFPDDVKPPVASSAFETASVVSVEEEMGSNKQCGVQQLPPLTINTRFALQQQEQIIEAEQSPPHQQTGGGDGGGGGAASAAGAASKFRFEEPDPKLEAGEDLHHFKPIISPTTTSHCSNNHHHKRLTLSADSLKIRADKKPSIAFSSTSTPPASASSSSSSSVLSSSQFRRNERLDRRFCVSIDILKGVEQTTNTARAATLAWMLLVWLVLPFATSFLAFGLVPFEADFWRALWPWILICISQGVVAVEVVSTVMFEIEYGVVVNEERPWLYLQSCVGSCVAALSVQSLMFAFDNHYSSIQTSRSWLVVLFAGYVGCAVAIVASFLNHSPSEPETRAALIRCALGLGFGTFASAFVYAIFTLIYVQYRHVGGQGAVGYILAFILPCLRPLLHVVLEHREFLQWGSQRWKGGQLCTEPLASIMLETWHGCFVSIIAACAASPIELAVSAVVQLTLYIRVLRHTYVAESSRERNKRRSNHKHKPRGGIGGEDGPNTFFSCCVCVPDSKVGIRYEKPAATKVTSPTALAAKSISVPAIVDVEAGSRDRIEKDHSLSPDTLSTSHDDDSAIVKQEPPQEASPTSQAENFLVNNDYDDEEEEDEEFKSAQPSDVTFEDDIEEVKSLSWIALSWLKGTLFPLVFLACSLLFSIGPNRNLFDASNELPVIPSSSTTLPAGKAWLSSLSSSAWGGVGSAAGGGLNAFASNLLCLSAFHFACLLFGSPWLSLVCKRDLVAVVSSHVFFHHFALVASMAVFALLVGFACIFADYGFNSQLTR